eukprot:TRINITY_DN10220_c0_g2_i1.p1 TRINITY_DN10220_c0_g2~~TRINITY_DN10220_c0_g2_i1.p1  ORF type:complete len:110 (-),score=6.61 TRINITY_DN10220_c0_g2_i1:91-420(-)
MNKAIKTLLLLMTSFYANPVLCAAINSGCYNECQALFRNISFNNPLVGLGYLIAPIVCFVLFTGKNTSGNSPPDKDTEAENLHKPIGRLFGILAVASVVLIVLVQLWRP